MILHELSLFNFCLYAGEQTFNLAPSTIYGKHRPIILCGGINGGGKTTLLDAVQLVLYGNRAKVSKRANLPYEDFLRECIHRSISPTDGASIALSFLYATEGKEHLYEVCRRWAEKGSGIREHLQVYKDGFHDDWLSDNWNTIVEELIPLGVSQLLFFDAEQIRFLADDHTGNEALSTAVKSLLGLDLAERLIADAKVVETRLAKDLTNNLENTGEISRLEDELSAKEDEKRRVKGELASFENDYQRADEETRRAELAYATAGGQHWEKRTKLQEQKHLLTDRSQHIELQLVQLAEGEYPLVLVRDLLTEVANQDDREQDAFKAQLLGETLETRDETLIVEMQKARLGKAKLGHLAEFLKADRNSRSEPFEAIDSIHKLSESARMTLKRLMSRDLDERCNSASDLMKEAQAVTHDLDSIERTLSAVPKEDSLKDVSENLKIAVRNAAVAADRIARAKKELASLEFEWNVLRRDYDRICREKIDEEIAGEETRRIADLAARTQSIMQTFLDKAATAKIDRLSALVSESFRFLLRKETLVERVEINPVDFSINLIDPDGNSIPKGRLSEGEKQVFAISVLWGLARASSRPLPTIIDTPMARLDEMHRDNLVERYFPNASHQVIILSTDTEINQRYFEALSPSISRSYFLNYSDSKKCTSVENGYFDWSIEQSMAKGASA